MYSFQVGMSSLSPVSKVTEGQQVGERCREEMKELLDKNRDLECRIITGRDKSAQLCEKVFLVCGGRVCGMYRRSG